MSNTTSFTVQDFIAMTCPDNIKWVAAIREDGEWCVFVRVGQKESCWLKNVDFATAVAAKRYAAEKFGL